MGNQDEPLAERPMWAARLGPVNPLSLDRAAIIMSGPVPALSGRPINRFGIGQPVRHVEDVYAGLRRSSLDQMLGAYGKLLRRAHDALDDGLHFLQLSSAG
jgi:hypothetical protein